MRLVLLDTGPLVAYLNRRDEHHEWAREILAELEPPLWTCESVLSEACFLLRRLEGGPAAVLELVSRGLVEPGFRLHAELDAVHRLMRSYASVPMSLADACLVRMSELERLAEVLTVDDDFRIYRRHRRRPIPVIMPPS